MPTPASSVRPSAVTSTVVPRRSERLLNITKVGLGVLLALHPAQVAVNAAVGAMIAGRSLPDPEAAT